MACQYACFAGVRFLYWPRAWHKTLHLCDRANSIIRSDIQDLTLSKSREGLFPHALSLKSIYEKLYKDSDPKCGVQFASLLNEAGWLGGKVLDKLINSTNHQLENRLT